jgi:hypothetical protein
MVTQGRSKVEMVVRWARTATGERFSVSFVGQ